MLGFPGFALPLIWYGQLLSAAPDFEGPSRITNGDVSLKVLLKSRFYRFLFKTTSGLIRRPLGFPSGGFKNTSASSRPPRRERREPSGVSFSDSPLPLSLYKNAITHWSYCIFNYKRPYELECFVILDLEISSTNIPPGTSSSRLPSEIDPPNLKLRRNIHTCIWGTYPSCYFRVQWR